MHCEGCGQMAIHFSCLGLSNNIRRGKLSWISEQCDEKKGGMTTSIADRLNSMETKLRELDQVKTRLFFLENSTKIPMSQKLFSTRFPQLLVTSSRQRLDSENSAFSTSSKRSKRTAEDMGEQANKKKQENFLIQGKSQKENFSGVARPKARLHVYIGWVNKESDETIIQSHYRNKKMPVMHIREITRDGADYQSFHAVFDMDYKKFIENGDSWPDGVTIGRFRLNENSKSWLKSLPKQTQSSSKDQTCK